MLDVVDGRGQGALRLRGDAPRHVDRLQAGILPDDGDHRDADVGKNVDRRAQRRQRTDDEDHQRQDDERVRPPQRDADKSNHAQEAPRMPDRTGIAACEVPLGADSAARAAQISASCAPHN